MAQMALQIDETKKGEWKSHSINSPEEVTKEKLGGEDSFS
jgi:hypothetical protein